MTTDQQIISRPHIRQSEEQITMRQTTDPATEWEIAATDAEACPARWIQQRADDRRAGQPRDMPSSAEGEIERELGALVDQAADALIAMEDNEGASD